MKNLGKIRKLASVAFLNGLRLHKDAITLFKVGSFPSSLALSILSQEEIGKSFLMSEVIFQNIDNEGIGEEESVLLLQSMLSHKTKQGWFSREVGDFFKYKYGSKKRSKIYNDVLSGKIEEDKQNSIYVGLTKTKNKLNLQKGKVIDPKARIKAKQAETHITRVNDFVIELIEMTRRGLGGVNVEEVNNVLTMELVVDLERMWPTKSIASKRKLSAYRKYDIDLDY